MRTIEKSLKLYDRAQKVIPGAAQTMSKMYGRFAQGVAPPFISGGSGAYVFDCDGNKYLDWTAALGPVILGYGALGPKTNAPKLRPSLPLPHLYEVELAEKLVEKIPCAEMVRFGKTGSDVTSAAVRLARHVTGRGGVVCMGYHGWHDWYAGTLPSPRSDGVPWGVREYVHKIDYSDLTTLKNLFEDPEKHIACLILEPMSRYAPEQANRQHLLKLKEMCAKHRVVLVFDEMIMGFRHAVGGGGELFGVEPDLACFGKAMGNGYSISALVGRRDLMQELEHLHFSGTFFGETIGLAAALDTIEFIHMNDVISRLWDKGTLLNPKIRRLINKHNLGNNGDSCVHLKGYGPWSSFEWKEECFEEQCLFLQEVVKRGILYSRDHFIMHAHTEEDIKKTLNVYDEVFGYIRDCMDKGTVNQNLEGRIEKEKFPR